MTQHGYMKLGRRTAGLIPQEMEFTPLVPSMSPEIASSSLES
jgi:hypothetical protein